MSPSPGPSCPFCTKAGRSLYWRDIGSTSNRRAKGWLYCPKHGPFKAGVP
jgi:hypothetical protein